MAAPENVSRKIDQLTFGASALEPTEGRRAAATPRTFQRILLAVDDSPASAPAIAWARDLALACGGRVWVVHAIAPPVTFAGEGGAYLWQTATPSTVAEAEAAGRGVLAKAVQALAGAGGEAPATVLAWGNPPAQIVRVAQEVDADLVILGSRRLGRLGRLLEGSVSDDVKHHVNASVLIAKGPPRAGPLLIATDGSSESLAAVGTGLTLAHAWHVEAEILHVLPLPFYGMPEAREREIQRAVNEVHPPEPEGRVRFRLDFGDAATRITAEAAASGAGLVVTGARGLGGLRSFVLGSVSNRLTHDAPCPVLVVKPRGA